MTVPRDTSVKSDIHRGYMAAAIQLGRRLHGKTWPNPAVGCIIVSDQDRVVGRGWTQASGRPHAETEALKQAGKAARGARAYVSLEPCAHKGQTEPCAQAFIDAGIAEVFIGCDDPDPRVAGRGVAMLEAAGIPVHRDVLGPDAKWANRGFLTRILKGRPWVSLKTAMTLDGRIATQIGESQWITGEQARLFGHRLRAEMDAIMVGSGTVMADNPSLTSRLSGLDDRNPLRLVCDSRLRIPLDCTLVRTAMTTPTWILSGPVDEARKTPYQDLGCRVIEGTIENDGRLDLEYVFRSLGDAGLNQVMVESGGALAASLIKAQLVDELLVFRASSIIGGDGIAAIGAFGLEHLSEMETFALREVRDLGPDRLEIYAK